MSRETAYAITALIRLAEEPKGTVLTATSIAEQQEISPAFLMKIMRKLMVHGLISSHRARPRGYSLSITPDAISLRRIIETVEGPDFFRRCLFGNERCDDGNPCILHELWADHRDRFLERINHVTLKDLVEQGSLEVEQ